MEQQITKKKFEEGYCAFTKDGNKAIKSYDDGKHLQVKLVDNIEDMEIDESKMMMEIYIRMYHERIGKEDFIIKKVKRTTTTTIDLDVVEE